MALSGSTDAKRKREAQDNEEPSKKRALEDATQTVKLTHMDNEEGWAPVIATSQGLQLPPQVSFLAFQKRPGKTTKPPDLFLHSADHARLHYTARRQPPNSTADSQLKHFMGIFDPESGEVKVVEAQRMEVRVTLKSEDKEMRDKELERIKTSLSTQRQELGAEFGTKKAKKAIKSLAENAIAPRFARGSSPDTTAKALKNDAAASVLLQSLQSSADTAPTREALQADIDEAKPRPKHNLAAKSVEEVYSLGKLCGTEMLQKLKVKPWMDAVDRGEPISVSSRFAATRIEDLVNSNADDSVLKVKSLRFLVLLKDFMDACQKLKQGGRKLPPADKLKLKCNSFDGNLVEEVRKRFASKGEMSKWQVDLLITHMCAISLLIDDHETDTYALREDLRLDVKDIKQYFAEIGAKCRSMYDGERQRQNLTKAEASMHIIASLRLPLEFPKARIVPRSGRR